MRSCWGRKPRLTEGDRPLRRRIRDTQRRSDHTSRRRQDYELPLDGKRSPHTVRLSPSRTAPAASRGRRRTRPPSAGSATAPAPRCGVEEVQRPRGLPALTTVSLGAWRVPRPRSTGARTIHPLPSWQCRRHPGWCGRSSVVREIFRMRRHRLASLGGIIPRHGTNPRTTTFAGRPPRLLDRMLRDHGGQQC